MKILIVDDEPPARQRLADLLTDTGAELTLFEAANGLEAIHLAEQERPETVLMDIRMPVMDGLESAFHMATLDPPPAIIFVSAYDEHAIRAFEANAVDYLLKPVRLERLKQALAKAEMINRSMISRVQAAQGQPARRTHLSAISQGRIQLIPIEEIQCFRADNKYVSVYRNGREILIDEPLKNLEEEFPDRFLRIHRNALVSISHIIAVEKTADGYQVELRGMAEKLPVSRRHVADIRQKLKNM